jgi:PAS domain S-box-containing protein
MGKLTVMLDREKPFGSAEPAALRFLDQRGEMAALMRSHEWEKTPLGPAAEWPELLKTFVSMMLASSQPMFLAWGGSLTWFYNDAFIAILGRKHGDALGRPSEYVWVEAWSTLRDLFARVFAGESVYMADLQLDLDRRGGLEEAHFAFSYNPVHDSTGSVAGLLGTCIETTEQVLATRRARKAEERLQLALSAGHGVGTWDWDIPNDRVFADERFAHWYGVDPQYAAAGAPIGSFLTSIHADDRADVQAQIAEAIRVGGDFITEYRLMRPDGSLRWVSAQGRCMVDSKGRPASFPGVTFDITARKVAEQQLRSLNQDLERQVAEQTRDRTRTWEVSPEIMGILNGDGYFEKSNPAWEAILGWSEEEIRTTKFLDFIHPDDLARTQASWEDAAQGKAALRFENRYRSKEGGWCWLSWIAVPEGGKIYCTARHITADKERASELQVAALERERLWLTSPDLLIVLGFDGTITRVNPAWTSILGFEIDELTGQNITELVDPADLQTTRDALQRAARASLPAVENRFRHKDGSERWFSWASSPAGDHIYAIGRHITAAKEAAAALARAEDALRQAQKMEAVGQLTGGIAHDFNNLLAGISGSLELIQLRISQNRLGDLDRYISAAQSASRRASSLTQRLLAFARRQTLDARPVDVNKLIAGMEELLRRSVGPLVEIEVVSAAELWTCRLDAAQLENAVLNLCINARDAMAPNGGRLTIETANERLEQRAAAELNLSPGQYVSIAVTDTGCGMPPEIINQVFDPFFTTKPMGQGTGLGLSMVYGFIRQSGGQVRVVSQVGSGTTLHLYVPRYVGQTYADESSPLVAVAPGAGETVLVIDDEATIRMVASEVLRESGYEVLEAQDGLSGLKILQSEIPIDLLVTDVGLPGGMNGRQVADAARSIRPDLKVLFITGYAESAIVGNGLLDDGMSVITKPFEMATFANKVRELIHQAVAD